MFSDAPLSVPVVQNVQGVTVDGSGVNCTDTIGHHVPLWGMHSRAQRERMAAGSSAHDRVYRLVSQIPETIGMGVARLMERDEISTHDVGALFRQVLESQRDLSRLTAPAKPHWSVWAALSAMVPILIGLVTLSYWTGVQGNRITQLELDKAGLAARIGTIEQRTERIPVIEQILIDIRERDKARQ